MRWCNIHILFMEKFGCGSDAMDFSASDALKKFKPFYCKCVEYSLARESVVCHDRTAQEN